MVQGVNEDSDILSMGNLLMQKVELLMVGIQTLCIPQTLRKMRLSEVLDVLRTGNIKTTDMVSCKEGIQNLYIRQALKRRAFEGTERCGIQEDALRSLIASGRRECKLERWSPSLVAFRPSSIPFKRH